MNFSVKNKRFVTNTPNSKEWMFGCSLFWMNSESNVLWCWFIVGVLRFSVQGKQVMFLCFDGRFFGHRLMPHSLSQSPCQHHPHMLHQGSRRDKARGSRDLWLYIIFVLSRKMVRCPLYFYSWPACWEYSISHVPRASPGFVF